MREQQKTGTWVWAQEPLISLPPYCNLVDYNFFLTGKTFLFLSKTMNMPSMASLARKAVGPDNNIVNTQRG